MKEGHIAHLSRMIEKSYLGTMKTSKEESNVNEKLQDILDWVMDCVRHFDIITIFDIRRETDLDKKILSALLKCHNMHIHTELNLAMVLDRVDLAEENIVGESLVGVSNIDSIMMDALHFERTDFVELLVMNGFVMRNFLTVERLRELYNRAVKLNLWIFKRIFLTILAPLD